MSKLTVCGGGNAAHVLAALGAHAGWEVDIFTPLADEVERMRSGVEQRGGIVARSNGYEYTGHPRCISANPEEVIPGSELILLALPTFAHGSTLRAIAGYLDPNSCIGVFPARGGFDYQVHNILDIAGLGLSFFGLQTLPWACRSASYGQEVEILGTKAEVDLAVFPQDRAAALIDQLAFIPDVKFSVVNSFLALTLANTGQLIHPGIMCGLCRGKEMETFTANDIPLFYQDIDQHTAELLQALSQDTQAVADALAVQLPSFQGHEIHALYEWILRAYSGAIQDTSRLRSAFVTNNAYAGLRLPVRPVDNDMFAVDFKARYLSEDVPFGLVVLKGIAELAGVSTPTLDEVIIWAQERLERVYFEDGMLTGADLVETRAPQAYGIHSLAKLTEVI
jgi:hypothetical protein